MYPVLDEASKSWFRIEPQRGRDVIEAYSRFQPQVIQAAGMVSLVVATLEIDAEPATAGAHQYRIEMFLVPDQRWPPQFLSALGPADFRRLLSS